VLINKSTAKKYETTNIIYMKSTPYISPYNEA